MRYIFTAAVCTLCAITALLALPPVGETEAVLVSVAAGERAALAATPDAPLVNPSPRQVMTPETTDEPVVDELALADAIDAIIASSTADDASTAGGDEASEDADFGSGVLGVTETAESPTDSSTTDAPTTSTSSSSTTTSTTTTSTTTTTVAPTTTTEAVPASETGGVIISNSGVVLPVIGAGSDGGWRALTPCGNEVTLQNGERVVSVDFVLDPGHGGSETGAVGPAGALEKQLNLRIAEIVEWYLEEAGYSVLLTRRTDIRIPLRSRAEIANALMPDAFVSIHHNGGATRPQTTPGTELFVDAGSPESRRLGGLIFEELSERMSAFEADWVGTWRNGVSARLNSDGADLYGIHRFTPDVVSVITEAGYLSNASEEKVFTDNDAQWAHGRAIAEAMMRWDRSSGDTGSGFLDDFTDDSSSGTGGFDGCEDPAL